STLSLHDALPISGGSAAAHLRDHRADAAFYASVDQPRPAAERSGRDDVDTLQSVAAVADPALWPDRACTLACADLWLAVAGLGLGATRDSSLGRTAVSRDRHPREACVQHDAFRLPGEVPLDGP